MKLVLAYLAVLSLEAFSAQAWHQRDTRRTNAFASKPGTCPSIPPMAVGICATTCYGDQSCGGDWKCCRNACGAFTCTPPAEPAYVTTPSPRATPTDRADVLPTDSEPGNEGPTPTVGEEGPNPRRPLGRGLFPGDGSFVDVPAETTASPTTTSTPATTTTTQRTSTTTTPVATTAAQTTRAADDRSLASRDQRCNLQADTGPCRGYFRRYYYNIQTGSCQQFGYGGCLGNANNFKTVEDCENACRIFQGAACPPCQEFDSLRPLYCSKKFVFIGEVKHLSTSGDVTTAKLQVKRLNVFRQGAMRFRGRAYFPSRFTAHVTIPDQDDDCACASLTVGEEYIFMGSTVNSSGAGVLGDGDYVRKVNSENSRELENMYRMGRSVVCRV